MFMRNNSHLWLKISTWATHYFEHLFFLLNEREKFDAHDNFSAFVFNIYWNVIDCFLKNQFCSAKLLLSFPILHHLTARHSWDVKYSDFKTSNVYQWNMEIIEFSMQWNIYTIWSCRIIVCNTISAWNIESSIKESLITSYQISEC